MSKELAKKGSTELAPASMLGMLAQDVEVNSGFQNMSSEDIALPFLSILQALSPQVRGTARIEDAQEGDFFNTVTNEVYKGHLKMIPCAYKKAYVEWTPREQGGGYVKEHLNATILESTKKDEKNRDILPNGNLIVTTAYHFVLIVKEGGMTERALISFTSTQLKKSRRWNSQMMNLQVKLTDGRLIRPPMYSHTYDVSTISESNDLGSWSGWNISSPQLITDTQLYTQAKEFSDDIMKGTIKVAPQQPSDSHEHSEPVNSTVL
jgi:hypothetical protein